MRIQSGITPVRPCELHYTLSNLLWNTILYNIFTLSNTLYRILCLQGNETSRYQWAAYTYAGELSTAAWGWNSYGVCFTLNAVYADNVHIHGVGRNFVSRSILDASSLDDAKKRIQVGNQATGHNINVIGLDDRKIVTIETGNLFFPVIQLHYLSLRSVTMWKQIYGRSCNNYIVCNDRSTHFCRALSEDISGSKLAQVVFTVLNRRLFHIMEEGTHGLRPSELDIGGSVRRSWHTKSCLDWGSVLQDFDALPAYVW